MGQFEETQEGDITIVSASGDIDTPATPELRNLIQRLLGEGRVKIVFDFGNLRYICSAGIATLISGSERIHERGGRIFICELHGQVRDTFHILQLNRAKTVLGISRSRKEAIEEMKLS